MTPTGWVNDFQTLTVDTTRSLGRGAGGREAAPTQPEPLDEVLTPPQVASLLRVPERTLADWRYMQKGPPSHKVGRHVRYLAEEVRAWLTCQ